MSTYLWKFTVRHIFGFKYWPRRLLRQWLTLWGGYLADRLRPRNKSIVYSNTESKVVSSFIIMQDKKQVYPMKTLLVSRIWHQHNVIMTTLCWWLHDENFKMLVSEPFSNIRHQHRCCQWSLLHIVENNLSEQFFRWLVLLFLENINWIKFFNDW